MRHETGPFDGVCEPEDAVEVRVQVQPFGKDVVYVDVNGVTVARIGGIKHGTVRLEVDDDLSLNRLNRNRQAYTVNGRLRRK